MAHLLSVATDGNHLSLAYNDPGTWSEKYNLVWDKVLGLNLFPASVAANEVSYYVTKLQAYGIPLESTTETAKLDWETWGRRRWRPTRPTSKRCSRRRTTT